MLDDPDSLKFQRLSPSEQARKASLVARGRAGLAGQHHHPATSDIAYSDEELVFLKAMDAFSRRTGRKFPTYREILSVLLEIGYRPPDSSCS